uniref:Uncharacterized protein n=1 Tax=Meloidogyne enterolobii TaxID=390850 RepID=A0A6V7U975_MELEN|nr:unnamed protein product [Meloidogyne enterolobii]
MVTARIIIIQILQVVMEKVYLMDNFHRQFLKNLLIGILRRKITLLKTITYLHSRAFQCLTITFK